MVQTAPQALLLAALAAAGGSRCYSWLCMAMSARLTTWVQFSAPNNLQNRQRVVHINAGAVSFASTLSRWLLCFVKSNGITGFGAAVARACLYSC